MLTFLVFLAFFWAQITMGILLSGNLEISLECPQKLWSQEEELHERVAAVDGDAITSLPIAAPQKNFTFYFSGLIHWALAWAFCYAYTVDQKGATLRTCARCRFGLQTI